MLAQISCINKYVLKNHTNIHTEVGKEKAELDFTCTPRKSDMLKNNTQCVFDSDQKEVEDIKISSLFQIQLLEWFECCQNILYYDVLVEFYALSLFDGFNTEKKLWYWSSLCFF